MPSLEERKGDEISEHVSPESLQWAQHCTEIVGSCTDDKAWCRELPKITSQEGAERGFPRRPEKLWNPCSLLPSLLPMSLITRWPELLALSPVPLCSHCQGHLPCCCPEQGKQGRGNQKDCPPQVSAASWASYESCPQRGESWQDLGLAAEEGNNCSGMVSPGGRRVGRG